MFIELLHNDALYDEIRDLLFRSIGYSSIAKMIDKEKRDTHLTYMFSIQRKVSPYKTSQILENISSVCNDEKKTHVLRADYVKSMGGVRITKIFFRKNILEVFFG